jgi:hypothetical protein
LLSWFELWRELSLSTEGNQSIPHELADRMISWSRSQEPVFFVLLWFSVDRLEIGCWCLEDIFSTLPRIYLQSFKSIRVVLIEFWTVLPWFMLLFLDSAEPPRKTWNLRDRAASAKNAEPPGISRPRSLRGKTRSLRTCMLKICVWALRVLVLRSVFCIDFLASQGSFSKYSCHQLAWVLWVENSLSLYRS